MVTTVSCRSRLQHLSRGGGKDSARIVRRLWILGRLQRVNRVRCSWGQHSSLYTQMGGWWHCDADGELCKQEVPVLHQPADVPLAKGHLQADHYQFTARPFPPFHQHCLYKQGKGTAPSQPPLLLQTRGSRKPTHLSFRKALW